MGSCFAAYSAQGDFGHGCSDVILKFAGYVPGVSSVTGPLRVLIGLVELVVGLIMGLIEHDLLDTSMNGIPQIFRGAVESVPVLGNICVIAFDIFSSCNK